jgi:hypothetical protein
LFKLDPVREGCGDDKKEKFKSGQKMYRDQIVGGKIKHQKE